MSKLYIKELNIDFFGKFVDKKIKFDEGFNLIYGENESGKSTLADFIEGVLYGFDQGKKRRSFSYKREKYYPGLAYGYGGSILFSYEDRDILVERNLDNGDYRMVDLSNKEEIDGPPSDLNFPGKYLLSLSYDAYKSLVKNYQSQSMDEDSKKTIMEIFTSSSPDLYFSANKAIANLEKNLEDLGSPRAYTKPYYITKKKIDDLEEKSYELKRLRKTYEKDLKKLHKQRKSLKIYRKKLDSYKEQRDTYRANLAHDNYKKHLEIKEELHLVNNKLSKYDIYKNVDKDYFTRLDRLIEENDRRDNAQQKSQRSFMPYMIVAGLIMFLAYALKNAYLLALLILIYPIYLKSNNSELDSFDDEIKKALDLYNLRDLGAYEKFKSSFYDYLSLKKDKENLREILDVLERQEMKESSPKDHIDLDITGLEEEIRRLEDAYSRLSLENIDLERKLASTEDRLENEVRIREDLSQQKKLLAKIEDEIAANKLAIDLINETQKDSGKKLIDLGDKVNKIIRQISKGSHRQIFYDDNLDPHIWLPEGGELRLDQLSKGFFDQLNFALKLVLRKDISSGKFVVFDDAFINYDEKRLKDTLYFLLDLAEDNQIIYFTCHMREEDIFKNEEIFVNKIILE